MNMWKVSALFGFLACGLLTDTLFGQAPLSLQASARKARTLAGEGVTIEVRQSLSTDLDMESLELNRDRTSIRITPLGAPGKARVLSGKDYIALHHPEPLTGIGRAFHGKAGTVWTSELNLLEYTYPLAAGRYTITVSYRYGDDATAVVHANEVGIEVVPTDLRTARFRWFGGAAARQEVGGLWAAEDAGRVRWFNQVSDGADPAAVVSTVELGWSIPVETAPRLAHLNDIADNHFERVAVWTEAGRLCWQKLADSGPIGSFACADTGLKPGQAVRLADPPLQLRGGGLAAIVTGEDVAGQPAASLVRVGAEGNPEHRVLPTGLAFAAEASVVWAESEDPARGTLYGFGHAEGQAAAANQFLRMDLESGKREVLLQTASEITWVEADQWLGQASVYAVVRLGDAVEVRGWSPRPATPVSIPFPTTWKLHDATTLANGQGLALSATTPGGWAVVTQREHWTGISPAPYVIASPAGLFLLQHDPNRGFYVLLRSEGGQTSNGAAPPDTELEPSSISPIHIGPPKS
jgi:hypothetical protein